MKFNNLPNPGLVCCLVLISLSACQSNYPPIIDAVNSNLILDSNPIAYTLSVSSHDEDGDSLGFLWSCKKGEFPQGTSFPTIKWIPPFNYYSANYLIIVIISDREFKVSDTIEIPVNGSPHLTDSRDGKVYGVVNIGSQTWFKENLDYQDDYFSKCYRDDTVMCKQYGHLYDWEAAKSACPAGWHLPSIDEWLTLLEWASPQPGLKLKSKTGWYENGNGRDTMGFNILPAGRWYLNEYFGHLGKHSSFWTTDEESSDIGKYIRFDYYGDGGYPYSTAKGNFFSVRCIQNR